jgi:hypothetical protein
MGSDVFLLFPILVDGRLAVFLDLEGNRWDLLGRDPRR